MYTSNCSMCGNLFEHRFPTQHVCEECKTRPCEICGKRFKRVDPYNQKYCSKECRTIGIRNPEHIANAEAKKRQSLMDKYGVTNVSQLDSVRQKISQVKKENYAPIRKEKEEEKQRQKEQKLRDKKEEKHQKEMAEKRAKLRKCKECGKLFLPTNGRNFYCKRDHYRTCKVCKVTYKVKYADLPYERNVCYNQKCATQWRIRRNIEIYGNADPGNSPENLQKRKEKWMEKYGVDNPFKSEEIKKKIKETNIQKYGVPYPAQNPDIRKKAQRTMLDNRNKDDIN